MPIAACLLVLSAFVAAPPQESLAKGDILDKVECRNHPGQSYALFVPTAYDPAKIWPILYAFDPGGRAREPLIRFKEAAEARGWIVACSFNSRNGPWAPVFAAVAAMQEDIHQRLAVDDERIFAAGFSGGARAVSIFSKMIGRPVAGVIACGAGLAEGLKVEDLETAAFYGIVGTDDFNFREVIVLDKLLDRRPDIPHWIRTFPGGHAWPPASVCAESLEWLDLVTAKRKGRPLEQPLAEALMAKAAARAASFEAEGAADRAVAELTAAASALSGIGDTDGLVTRAAGIRKTAAFKKSAGIDEERERDEARLLAELYKSLDANDKSVILRQDLVPLYNRIDRLLREAEKAGDSSGGKYARRVLLDVVMRAQNRGAGLLASTTPVKAVLCFEIAVRASEYEPARHRGMLYNLACAHARSGNARKALENLRRAVVEGLSDRNLILSDADLESIRDTPEFREILSGIR